MIGRIPRTLTIKPGDVLDAKYVVEGLLGEGGMGYVLAARHRTLGQGVAIKVLLPELLHSADAIARFVREARAAVALTSDHVTRVLDVGTTEAGIPYIVMERLIGETLGALEQRGSRMSRPLPIKTAIAYMLEVGDALIEAHALGIIHRDLKPENVFIVKKPNGKQYAKVMDFGVSRIDNTAIAGANAQALTTAGGALGTPAFMAPEQMSATTAKPITNKVDVWAFGATLYTALAGAQPFEAETIFALTIKVYNDEPVPITTYRRDLPPSLVAVIHDCLIKDPNARPSLADVLGRLEAIRDELPTAVVMVSPAAGLDDPTLPLERVTSSSSSPSDVMDAATTHAAMFTPSSPSRDRYTPTHPLNVGPATPPGLHALGVAVDASADRQQRDLILRTASPMTTSPSARRQQSGSPIAAVASAGAILAAIVGGALILVLTQRSSRHHQDNAAASSPSPSATVTMLAPPDVVPPEKTEAPAPPPPEVAAASSEQPLEQPSPPPTLLSSSSPTPTPHSKTTPAVVQRSKPRVIDAGTSSSQALTKER